MSNGQKHSKIIDFSLGFREAFSLCCLSVYGFIQSNTMKLGGLGKDTCFSDEMQCPYEDSCESLNHSWQGNGERLPYTPISRNVWIELFNIIPGQFLVIRIL